MTEQESNARIAQLEADLATLKSKMQTVVDAIKATVKNDIQDSERRVTEFLGDRLTDVTNKAQGNFNEIVGLKTAIWGDKDKERTPGLINEQVEIERDVQALMKLKEQWDGESGSEDKPGAEAIVNRLWLEYRDRTTRSKTFQAIGAGGGITFLVIAFNLISGAIDKSATANAAKAAETNAKVTEVQSLFHNLDKTFAVKLAELTKDIQRLDGKK